MKNRIIDGFHRIFSREQQLQLLVIAMVMVIAMASIGTYAWYYNRRQLYTYTEVQEPTTLDIKGPDETYIMKLDLGNINLKADTKKKYIVFCVTTLSSHSYQLELAYTTNIAFEYQLYHATRSTEKPANEDDILYTYNNDENEENEVYYSALGDALQGSILNQSETKAVTYAEGDEVQDDANPKYFLVDEKILPDKYNKEGQKHESEYVNYYVLELNWEKLQSADYTKETDMIYVMAENTTE